MMGGPVLGLVPDGGGPTGARPFWATELVDVTVAGVSDEIRPRVPHSSQRGSHLGE